MAFVVFLIIQVAVVLVAILLLRHGTSNRLAQRLGPDVAGDDLRLYGWVCVAAAALCMAGVAALSSPLQTVAHAGALTVALVGGVAGIQWWDRSTSLRERQRALALTGLADLVSRSGRDLDLDRLSASVAGLDDPMVDVLASVRRAGPSPRAARLRQLDDGVRAARSREEETWLLAARVVVNADSRATYAPDLQRVVAAMLSPHPLAAALTASIARSGPDPEAGLEACRLLATACQDVADARLLRRTREDPLQGGDRTDRLTSPGRRDGEEQAAPRR